jgi:hypothetical protein
MSTAISFGFLLARNTPANTSAIPVICVGNIFSFNNQTASKLLNTGIRFPNMEVRAAPSLAMAAFQQKNEITDAPAPK